MLLWGFRSFTQSPQPNSGTTTQAGRHNRSPSRAMQFIILNHYTTSQLHSKQIMQL